MLQAYRETYRPALDAVEAEVREAVHALHLEADAHIGTRPAKTIRAILRKLARERTRLSKMQDIAGCRVVVPNLDH